MTRNAITLAILFYLPLLVLGDTKKERLPGHRNLFNGDCTFLFGDNFVENPKAKYDKKTLHWFIDMLADSGVDTYLCNTNGQQPWYPSKRTSNNLTGYKRGDVEFFRGHFRPGLPKDRLEKAMAEQAVFLDRYLDLADEGVVWIDEISKACRRRKISPWISIRMNDMHGANSWEKSYMNCELQKDPKYRLSGRNMNPRDGVDRMLQSLDYSHKEVRDYFLLQIRELLEDHDFEGLELDWLRCPFCLDPPASAQSVAVITEWHAEIRKLTQAKAKQSGKPFPLGLRIPARLGFLKSVGLDVKAMAQAGTIDFVGVSNFWQTSWDIPYEELRRDLGDRVAIYGVIEDAPNWMYGLDPTTKKKSYRLLTASPELLRGNAAGKLAMGVDGIETFNFFCTDEGDHNPAADKRQARYPDLRDLHKLSSLRGQTKHYALATAQGHFLFPFWEYADQIPATIEPQATRAFRLSMAAEPADRGLELIVQLVLDRADKAPDLGVSFNECWPNFKAEDTDRLLFPTGIYTHHLPEHRALNYRFPVSEIRDGWNEVLVLNSAKHKSAKERQENTARIVSVELGVKKR